MSEPQAAVNEAGEGPAEATFRWADHHFVSGALCLDFANSVVFRNDPARREDRLGTAVDLHAWAAAAGLAVEDGAFSPAGLRQLLRLREATDRLFRAVAAGAEPDRAALAVVLDCYRRKLARLPLAAGPGGLCLAADQAAARQLPLGARLAASAIELAFSPRLGRVRACPGCAWLVLDRSRNGGKKWCDMRLCGNRAKAQRHYSRRRAGRASGGTP